MKQTLREWLDHQRHIMKHDPEVDSDHHEKALRIIGAFMVEVSRWGGSHQNVTELTAVAERIINEDQP